MFRLIVIFLPCLIAVAATVIAYKLPRIGSESQHLRRLVLSAALVGLLCSALTWWQEARLAEEVLQKGNAGSEHIAQEAANRTAEEIRGQYEQKISTLNNKIAELQ